MQATFQSRDSITKGPQALEQYFKNRVVSENQLHAIFLNCWKKKNQFVNFLPILMKKGANINCLGQGADKKTIFMHACLSGSVQIVKKMIQYNIDFHLKDNQNKNALFYAIQSNKEQSITILNLILQKCPELVNSEASNKKSLLIYAVEKCNKQIVKLILEKGANVNNFLQDTMDNPLHVAIKKYRKKGVDSSASINIITNLLQKKCNHLAKNKQGYSPMDLCKDEQLKKTIEQIINTVNYKNQQQEKKKLMIKNQQFPRDNSNREILKIHNITKSKLSKNIPILKINDKNDEYNLMTQAAGFFQEFILEKEKKLQEQKRRQEKQNERLERQRKQEIVRNEEWLIPTQQLRYYLQQQIRIFTDEIQNQNKCNKQEFDELIRQISEPLQKTLNLKICVYGSYATRLCLKESDIDVVAIPNNSIVNITQFMENIDKILKTLEFVKQTKFISTAFIPVIKVFCNQHYKNKKLDITLQNINHNGLACVELIKQYMNQYEELRPLAFVLKTFLYRSNLYDTYQGGLSSYGLILMIVAFLQESYFYRKNNEKIKISELLIRFLKFFGLDFDYINKGIYLLNPFAENPDYKGFVFTVSDPMYQIDVSPKLFLLDPLNMSNNVGRSTHQIKSIKMAFCIAYTTIHTNYNCRAACKYRNSANTLKIPKEYSGKEKTRPCCILRRMFECSRMFQPFQW